MAEPLAPKYVRGSKGVESVERIKLMKLLWDAVGTKFAGRHDTSGTMGEGTSLFANRQK